MAILALAAPATAVSNGPGGGTISGSVLPSQLLPPLVASMSNAGTGGTVAAGVYLAEVTYVTAAGETTASGLATTTTAGTTSTLTVNSPPASGNATGWYAYVSQVGGVTLTRQQTAGQPTAIGTNLTLTAPPTNTGLNPPASNTTAAEANSTSGFTGASVPNNGSVLVRVTCTTAGTISFTCQKTIFGGSVPATVFQQSLIAGTTYVFGPFPVFEFNDVNGLLQMTGTFFGGAGNNIGVYQLPGSVAGV